MVIATHVHLDHAGGVGLLMQQLPPGPPRRASARRAPHDRPGAPDRERDRGLRRARRWTRSYGTLVRVAAERVLETARRHDARRSPAGRCCSSTRRATRAITTASGTSAAAASSPATPSACRTASSTPRAAPGSCRRRRRCSSSPRPCAARSSACWRSRRGGCYLTHYGRVGDVPRLGALLLDQLDEMVALGPLARQGARAARGAEARARGAPPAEPARARRRAAPTSASASCSRSTSSSTRRASASGSTAPEPEHHEPRTRFDFSGQVVVVTGAAKASAPPAPRLFARDGAAVALWDVDDARGAGARRRARRAAPRADLHCDVASQAEVDAALAATLAAFGRDRRAGQQRRHLQRRRLPRHHRSRLGRGDRRQPQGRVPRRPGGGARDGRGRAAARSST